MTAPLTLLTPTVESFAALRQAGTSVWLDDLSRARLDSGDLARLHRDYGVVGVTTNPAIFSKAITGSRDYDALMTRAVEAGLTTPDLVVAALTMNDVRDACDVFRPLFEATGGRDGRVSLEVDPRLAYDTDATISQALEIWESVGRDNLMVKIPATTEGLPAITEVTARGVSVNVTLIFSRARHREVMEAYVEGLRKAHALDRDLSTIHSVASLFVSRVDAAVDRALADLGHEEDSPLRGTAGLANARAAYAEYLDFFAGDSTGHFAELEEAGAHRQRLLWASTATKNPAYPDTMYITELAGPETVSTIPQATMDAVADHGIVSGDTLSDARGLARRHLAALEEAGIDFGDVFASLEKEGVEAFITAWTTLLSSVEQRLNTLT